MISNRQKTVALNLPRVRCYARRLRSTLRLGRRDFNVSFVSDTEIERLNRAYRGKPRPTDVLSFPWNGVEQNSFAGAPEGEFKHFLGDIVISAEAARRNARAEGHSTQTEIRWLILHGVLHLLGYDHASDSGEMNSFEYSLRERLGIQGTSGSRRINYSRRPLPA